MQFRLSVHVVVVIAFTLEVAWGNNMTINESGR